MTLSRKLKKRGIVREKKEVLKKKGGGLTSGFSIIKKEKEEFERKRNSNLSTRDGIWEIFCNKKEDKTFVFDWDGQPENLRSTLVHNVKIGKFWKRKQCSCEIGEECGACNTNNKVKKKSRFVVLPLVDRSVWVDKKGKEYKDRLGYILVGAKTQIDVFIEMAEYLQEDIGVAFNEIEFKVKKVGDGAQTTYNLKPILKSQKIVKKLSAKFQKLFDNFDVTKCQFTPLSVEEWEEVIYECSDDVEEEKNYSWGR